MKNFILTAVLTASVIFGYSQTKIVGKVVYLNSGKKAAEGVKINASGSSGTYSRTDGTFTLNFPHYSAGTTVYPEVGRTLVTNEGKKKEIELVNKDKLKWINIPKAPKTEPLTIVVCPKGFRDKTAQKYYKIIKTEADHQLELRKKEIIDLQEKLGVSHNLVIQKQEELARIYSQNDSLSLYKEACEIASINRDYAAQRIRNYLDALDAGVNIEEARKELSTKKAYEEAILAEAVIFSSIEEIERDAKNLTTQYRFVEAIQKYDTMLLLLNHDMIDPLRMYGKVLDVANICRLQNYNSEALGYFNSALNILSNYKGYSFEKAIIHNELGLVYKGMNRFLEAIESHEACIQFLRPLALENPEYYAQDIALNYINLGVLQRSIGEHSRAIVLYTEAIDIYEQLNQIYPHAFDMFVAQANGNLGSAYLEIEEHSKADSVLLESLTFYNSQYSIDSTSFMEELAEIQNKLGLLYTSQNKNEASHEFLTEALEKYRLLAKTNPRRFNLRLALTLNNLGNNYLELGQKDSALEAYSDALDLFSEVAELDPESGLPYVALVKNNLAVLFEQHNSIIQSEQHYKESLEIYEFLVEVKPKTYTKDYIGTYGHLASLYADQLMFKKVDVILFEVLALHKSQNEDGSDMYDMTMLNECLRYAVIKKQQLKNNFTDSTKITGLELVRLGNEIISNTKAMNPRINKLRSNFIDLENFFTSATAESIELEKVKSNTKLQKVIYREAGER